MLDELLPAAQSLAANLEKMCLSISKSKTAILSNSKTAAKALRGALGDLGGPSISEARALGVDFWAGRSAGRPKLNVRSARIRKARLGRFRLFSLRKTNRAISHKVYVCGTLPSIMYDAPILGFSGRQLLSLRREAGTMTGLGGKKRSLDLALSFSPKADPEVVASTALVSRLAKEVWGAALPLDMRDKATLGLGIMAAGIQAYLRAHRVPPKYITGPISSVHQALRRAGWIFHSPLALSSKYGKLYNLTLCCPARVVDAYRADLCSSIQMRAIRRRHVSYASDVSQDIIDSEVFFGPLASLYKKLPRPKASVLAALVSNGIFTAMDLYNQGYDMDPM